jgi:hypothetical protein
VDVAGRRSLRIPKVNARATLASPLLPPVRPTSDKDAACRMTAREVNQGGWGQY